MYRKRSQSKECSLPQSKVQRMREGIGKDDVQNNKNDKADAMQRLRSSLLRNVRARTAGNQIRRIDEKELFFPWSNSSLLRVHCRYGLLAAGARSTTQFHVYASVKSSRTFRATLYFFTCHVQMIQSIAFV